MPYDYCLDVEHHLQHTVDDGTSITRKEFSHLKYSYKRSDYFIIMFIFAMPLMFFSCFCDTKRSERSDIAWHNLKECSTKVQRNLES